MWPRSADSSERRSSTPRRIIVKVVSKMGTPSASSGRPIPVRVCVFAWQTTLPAAMMKPRNMLPPSPMKIRAGLKLKNRKPVRLPSSASISTSMTI